MITNSPLKFFSYGRILLALTLFVFLNHSESFAQSEVTDMETNNRALYWIRYYNSWSINDKIDLNTEIDNRRFFRPDEQFQTLFRTTLTYKFSDNAKAGVGAAYSMLYINEIDLMIPEIRPHQQIEFSHGPGRFEFEHRIRVEQQFDRDTTGIELANHYDFTLRGRYKLQLGYLLVDRDKKAGNFVLQAHSEIMAKIQQEEAFDQFRVYAGINYYILDDLQIDLGYMKYIERKYGENRLDNFDVYRLTLRHAI